MLRLEGNDVAVSHDAFTALEMARDVKPDTVLLDIGLPRMSGYDVCRQLRQQSWARDAVIRRRWC